jgi:flagellar hook-associated protein 1 FlgK
MSLTSILSIARSALVLQQRAMDVTSHNIANAGTDGYRRQRLELTTADPLRTPQGTIGRGVRSEGNSRARDRYLDTSFRQESGLQGRYGTMSDILGDIEGVFDESGGTGLATGLDDLLDAFSDLANDPSSITARSQVQSSAQALIRQFNGAANRLASAEADVQSRMQAAIGQVNSYAGEIADLNRQIVAAAKGVSAPDLEDRRDLLIDQLSQVADVQVVEHTDHSVGVIAGGALLVDGAQHSSLELRSLPAGGFGVGVTGTGAALSLRSGQLKALSDLSSSTIPGIRKQLDGFAAAVVTEVNAIHRTGKTVAGAGNTDFFDPAGLTASSMALTATVRQNPAAVAAGTTGSPGDASVALRLAALRTGGVASAGGQTLSEMYNGVVTSVATLSQAAQRGAASQDTMVANVTAQRSSVSDVSIDEEMVSLIQGQQAFAAASKIVSAADQMIQSLLDMV